jgi:hypothetical protein
MLLPGQIPLPGITTVRTDHANFVECHNELRPRERFDLADDPREMRNIIDSPRGRRLAQGLKGELETLRRETGYGFLTRG